MRQGNNPRRPRTRGNGRRHSSSRGGNVESNGPDVKVRGTAQQVHEKYLALAHDASSAGDRVAAENYYQHADHYFRLVNGDNAPGNGQARDAQSRGPRAQPDNKTNPQPDPATEAQPDIPAHDGGSGPASV